jgi:endogenous inhibitor of DNA gyrase (YacG/DUF329 family)
MAIVQLKCPETGNPIDLGDVAPNANLAAALYATEIPCPHCGKKHRWTSGHDALVLRTLQASPEASRVLVEGESATALP